MFRLNHWLLFIRSFYFQSLTRVYRHVNAWTLFSQQISFWLTSCLVEIIWPICNWLSQKLEGIGDVFEENGQVAVLAGDVEKWSSSPINVKSSSNFGKSSIIIMSYRDHEMATIKDKLQTHTLYSGWLQRFTSWPADCHSFHSNLFCMS